MILVIPLPLTNKDMEGIAISSAYPYGYVYKSQADTCTASDTPMGYTSAY